MNKRDITLTIEVLNDKIVDCKLQIKLHPESEDYFWGKVEGLEYAIRQLTSLL
jgi:hypothetical protein